MTYAYTAILDEQIPPAAEPVFQHLLDTYTSETDKVISLWREFSDADLGYRPHSRSSTVREIFRHQLLSERRFFGEFMGISEPPPDQVLPATDTVRAYVDRMRELALARLPQFAGKRQPWWLEERPFFDVSRQRIWIFWRRVLHTAHHRAQLTVYLRLLDKTVPSTYGPTADVTWEGADATHTVDAAGRK